MFELLREQVKSDTETLASEGHPLTYKQLNHLKFLVLYAPNPEKIYHRSAVFELKIHGHGPIAVSTNNRSGKEASLFETSVRFFEETKSCHLMIGGEPQDLWQVSHKALDPLL